MNPDDNVDHHTARTNPNSPLNNLVTGNPSLINWHCYCRLGGTLAYILFMMILCHMKGLWLFTPSQGIEP